jgi:DNA-binding NtrC family response regulator
MAISSRVVLIVDDEANVLSAFRRSLGQEACLLLSASSVAEALDLVRQERVDVVVSNARLPDGTGLALLQEIERLFPDTMRILLTEQSGLSDAVEAMGRGEIYRFLTNPRDAVELRGVVRGALARLRRERDNNRVLARVRGEIHAAIAHAHPELHLIRDATGSILLDDSEGEEVALAVG